MRRLLLIAMLCILPAFLSAQEVTVPVHIDVEGLEPGISKITYAEFVVKFGKPDKYEKYESEFGMTENYKIRQNSFHCEENGILHNFYIEDNKFRALTFCIKGGVKAGDDFKKIDTLQPKHIATYPDGSSEYTLFEDRMDGKVVVFISKGKIESISYNLPF